MQQIELVQLERSRNHTYVMKNSKQVKLTRDFAGKNSLLALGFKPIIVWPFAKASLSFEGFASS